MVAACASWEESSASAMKGRLRSQDGVFGLLDENLVLNILEKIHDRGDRQALCLVCKLFWKLEASSRKKIQLLQGEVLKEVLNRYTEVEELDLSLCSQVNDEALEAVGTISGKRLLSVSLARINQFSEAGLIELLEQCPSLRELDLSFCSEITDCSMQAIAQLETLESLKLVDSRSITDAGLGYVAAGCKSLRYLSLRRCLGITDSGISVIAVSCVHLEWLDLSFTEVALRGLKSLTLLQSLKDLILVSCNRVDDAGLACLTQCGKSLQVLDVARCLQLSEWSVMALAGAPASLEKLTLSYSISISKEVVLSFEKLKSLKVIRLDGCEIQTDGLTSISTGCKLLKEFSVSKCTGVTDAGIFAIVEGCFGLDKLDLTCCRELTDSAVASIASSCGRLRSLKMEACSQVTQKGFGLLGKGCTGLEELDLTDCSIDDEGLKWIARCAALRSLKLGCCLNISDKGIAAICASCNNLRELDLYRSLELGDSSILAIATGCPRLRVLNLSYCQQITDSSLRSVSHLRDLTKLEIRACLQITSAGLSAVAAGCRQLLELDIKSCTAIDDSGLISIAEGCKNLRKVNLSFCQITDVGLLAISSLSYMQNMKLLHLDKVTIKGLKDALFICSSLKKVKLVQALAMHLSISFVQKIKAQGCRFRWMDKPYAGLIQAFSS